MTMNRVQFQPGLSMPEFFERYGTEAQCQAALQAARWPSGFVCPDCGGAARTQLRARRAALLAVRRLPPPVQPDQRHDLRGQQAAADALVPGHAAAHPVQEQRLGAGAHAPARRVLPQRLADEAQDHGGHAPARGARASSTAAWRSTTPTSAASARAARPGAARRTRCPSSRRCRPPPSGHPLLACLRQQPHTTEAGGGVRRQHIAPSATVVSDGLWCFAATAIVGAEHERVVTGGGKASVKLPQFKAITPCTQKAISSLSDVLRFVERFRSLTYDARSNMFVSNVAIQRRREGPTLERCIRSAHPRPRCRAGRGDADRGIRLVWTASLSLLAGGSGAQSSGAGLGTQRGRHRQGARGHRDEAARARARHGFDDRRRRLACCLGIAGSGAPAWLSAARAAQSASSIASIVCSAPSSNRSTTSWFRIAPAAPAGPAE